MKVGNINFRIKEYIMDYKQISEYQYGGWEWLMTKYICVDVLKLESMGVEFYLWTHLIF